MRYARRVNQSGFTLLEVMIGITIGLLLLVALASLFSSSSSSQREMQNVAQQIENGRYAIDTISQDLRLAGYLGTYMQATAPATLPDPCDQTQATLQAAIGLPVQGYYAANLVSDSVTTPLCATWLTPTNLANGSDVLVVRRVNTDPVAITAIAPAGEVYLQANATTPQVQFGSGAAVTCTSTAAGATTTIFRKCTNPAASDVCSATCTGGGSPAAEIRKLHVHIYFVASCAVPAGGGSLCTGANDDGGYPIPTLKRLDLTSVGGATNFQVVSIAEGVQYMKVEYGIDDTPAAANPDTGLVGDGVPDRYTFSPSVSDFANAVTVRVDILAQAPTPSAGYTDIKTYNLSVSPTAPTVPAFTVGPFNDQYRRHVYAAKVRLVNVSSRKENPQ